LTINDSEEKEKMLVIIDHGVGNFGSVANAMELLGIEHCISADPTVIARADRILLPGTGSFGAGMHHLQARGLIPVLNEKVIIQRTPCMGICLGMQLLCRSSEETPGVAGLGWIQADVMKIRGENLLLPHVGWSEVVQAGAGTFFNGLEKPTFYFSHSFYLELDDSSNLAGSCSYGKPICAAIQRGNIFATQFHPEKSQHDGLELLKRFVRWDGR
jgi:glutamine amidotransferase